MQITGVSSSPPKAQSAADLAQDYAQQMQNIAGSSSQAWSFAQALTHSTTGLTLASDSSNPTLAARDQADAALVQSYNSKLEDRYQADQKAGDSGAQTSADLLSFQLSFPQSYWAARDPDQLYTNEGSPEAVAKAQLQDLTGAITPST